MMKFLILFCLLGTRFAWAAYSPETIITDPNTPANKATVKAASTSPLATDPALVVAISPNSPPGATSDRADGPSSPGAAPVYSLLIGAQYNSTLPTLTNTEQSALQMDLNGRLLVSQGGAAALGGAWPFKLTDGTNVMPTMDAAARRGYFSPTDGTNFMPMLDATARAGYFKLTDGANIAPTMDVAARAAFQKITDGTNTSAVKAASTAALSTDPALVVAVSPNNSVAVTGTFWQATQPVSGTFWQATQPVSGTFWQATQPVSIAAAIPTKAPINSTASMSQNSVTTTGSTIGLIANANEVVVQNDNSSTDCIRYAFGSTATSTSGMVLQPGQDSGAIHSGAALSVTACSGTQKVNVQSMAQ